MRLLVSALSVLTCLVAGPGHAATRAGTLGVTAVVVDRCQILQSPRQSTQVSCDRQVPYRVERQPIVRPETPSVRVIGTVIIY